MTFGLEGDGAALDQQFAVFDQFFGVFVVGVVLGLGVFEDDFAFVDVFDRSRTVHFEFERDPLVAVVGFGIRFRAVGHEDLVFVVDVGAGGAEVGSCAVFFSVAAEHLRFDRDGEFLVLRHRSRVLPVQHHAAVADRPTGTAGALFIDESILDPQTIMRKRFFVKQMSELTVVFLVLVVPDFDQTILDAEGIPEVFSEFVLGDLGGPTGEVLAVEKLHPLTVGGSADGWKQECRKAESEESGCFFHRFLLMDWSGNC